MYVKIRTILFPYLLAHLNSYIRQKQLNLLLCEQSRDWSVDKMITLILSFRVGISKNKNIDHGVKETCAIMATTVTQEIGHISLL